MTTKETRKAKKPQRRKNGKEEKDIQFTCRTRFSKRIVTGSISKEQESVREENRRETSSYFFDEAEKNRFRVIITKRETGTKPGMA